MRRGIPWHWFRFDLRFALFVTTIVAIYCGAGAAWGRWLGLDANEVLRHLSVNLLSDVPQFLLYLLAGMVFFNRWNVHPRVSLLGLIAITGFLALVASRPFLMMAVESASPGSDSLQRLLLVWGIWWRLVSIVSFALLVAAALVDRQPKPPETNREHDSDALA